MAEFPKPEHGDDSKLRAEDEANGEAVVKFGKGGSHGGGEGHASSGRSPAFGTYETLQNLQREIRLVAVLTIPSSPLASPRSDPASCSPRFSVRPYMIGGDDLSARVVKNQGDCRIPTFVELDPETDLNIPPPGWLTCQNQNTWRVATSQGELAMVERAAGQITGALADLRMSAREEPADFISSSTTMKTIFELPFSSASVTIAVHRVENSLILNGLINGELEESKVNASSSGKSDASTSKKRRKGAESRSLYNKFMYYSVSGANGDVEPLVENEVGEGLVREERKEEKNEESLQCFRRAIHFQFHHLGLLLGSDTVMVNRGATHPEVSVRLEEVDAEVTKLTCLDFWLDNVPAAAGQ